MFNIGEKKPYVMPAECAHCAREAGTMSYTITTEVAIPTTVVIVQSSTSFQVMVCEACYRKLGAERDKWSRLQGMAMLALVLSSITFFAGMIYLWLTQDYSFVSLLFWGPLGLGIIGGIALIFLKALGDPYVTGGIVGRFSAGKFGFNNRTYHARFLALNPTITHKQ